MKLVKTTTLVFAEGKSDKVYEVDLCEVGPGKFVVNFRYGKRGAPLKDGTKTVAPVAQAEAERVYDKLVQQQIEKGYLPEGAARPAPPAPPPAGTGARAAPAPTSSRQKDRILERLAATGPDRRWFKRAGHEKAWDLDRAIWRAGELRLREAEPLLLALVGTGQGGAKRPAPPPAPATPSPVRSGITADSFRGGAPSFRGRVVSQSAAAIMVILDDGREVVVHRALTLWPSGSAHSSLGPGGRMEMTLRMHAGRLHAERAWVEGHFEARSAPPPPRPSAAPAPQVQAPAGEAGGGKALRDYCIAWALGRLGGPASMETLSNLFADAASQGHVKRIATLALQSLSDEATRAEFADHMIASLPEALQAPARGADPEAFARALAAHVDANPGDGFAAVDVAYVVDTPTVRPGVLAELARVPFASPHFYWLRHVLKAAEYRRDAEVFGLLAYRLEKERAAFSHANYSYRYPRPGQPPMAYGAHTRRYLRRRVWRTLRRMGAIGDPDYVKMAVGVLLPFTDADGEEPRRVGRASWDRFARYWAFGGVLFANSPRYEQATNGKTWRCKAGVRPGTPSPAAREEAFPALWDARPAGLMHLLAASACLPVHEMAAKAIRASGAFLDQLDVDDVIMLLGRPYEVTAALGLELAEKRWSPAAPSLPLLLGLATTVYAPARRRAHGWIDEARALVLADAAFLAKIVLAPHADTREVARRILRSQALPPAVAGPLVARIVAEMLALGASPDDDARARDATQTLVMALAAHLEGIQAPVVNDLLAHPAAGVQELGAELLLRASASRAGPLDDETMVRILHSEHENVRAVGTRLLGELPDDVLAQMELLLVRLTTDKAADLRNASRPIVARVAAKNAGAGETIARALVLALVRNKLPEGAPSHVLRVLREDLFGFVKALPAEDVFRLLQSKSAHAQELGGLLLQDRDPSELSIEQIVKLASHDVLSVREASWRAFSASIDRVKASLAEASRVLDATWDDSRAFAFGFFRERLGADAFHADVLVTILDSVRPDVQAFGRELTTRWFRDEDGPALMTKLSEHPSVAVQLFTTNYLERYATDRPGQLESLMPYFTSVVSRVNQGRVAKQRVLAFLEAEGQKSPEAARLVIDLLHRLAAVVAVEYRGAAIAAMVAIHHAQPGVPLPLRIKPPPARGAHGVPVRV